MARARRRNAKGRVMRRAVEWLEDLAFKAIMVILGGFLLLFGLWIMFSVGS